jgi:hypothetical protein
MMLLELEVLMLDDTTTYLADLDELSFFSFAVLTADGNSSDELQLDRTTQGVVDLGRIYCIYPGTAFTF